MDRDFTREKHLQTEAMHLQKSAMEGEDMAERTAGAAKRWIRAHASLVTAIEQTFGQMALDDWAMQLYERRIQDSNEHIRYWREVQADTGSAERRP